MRPELKLVEDHGIAAAAFAEAMRALASGVVVVTCTVEGRPWGVTVTAFASVSADPPTVLVSLGSNGTAARAIAARRRFGVSILGGSQLDVAVRGSTPGAPKFLDAPAIEGALADLECEVSHSVDVADHTIFFGRVVRARTAPTGAPLLYHRRDYRRLAAGSAVAPPIERRRHA